MVVVEHVVNLQLRRNSLRDLLGILCGITVVAVRTDVVENRIFLQRLTVAVVTCQERGSDVESTLTVIKVEDILKCDSILIIPQYIFLEAKAIALRLLQSDAHYGFS